MFFDVVFIKYWFDSWMEIVSSLVSIVTDAKDKDKELKNLHNQLSYCLHKAKSIDAKYTTGR